MTYDAVIIGLGAMGSAAAYQLAKRKAKVLGIDRFSPPHNLGSTHGETRVTRKAIGEGAEYVPLTLRSYEIFREIEAETGVDLLTITGGLIISATDGTANLHGNDGFIETTVSTAEKFGIEHKVLGAEEISGQFPQFNLSGSEYGYYEPEMGFLRPENCVAAQLKLAAKYGAVIQRDEEVIAIRNFPGGIEVTTDRAVYRAAKIIISAGAWVKDFIGKPRQHLFRVYRQVFYWFDVSENYKQFKPGNFPIFIWEFGRWENDFVYGFPAIDGEKGGLKCAIETYLETTDADRVNRQVSKKEIAEIFEKYLENRIAGVSQKCLKTATCLYTVMPRAKFLIDHLPGNKRIIVASPCSGHGFKHSAAIGEILAQLVTEGKSLIDISAFSFDKF